VRQDARDSWLKKRTRAAGMSLVADARVENAVGKVSFRGRRRV
jgi:hypothetical protein